MSLSSTQKLALRKAARAEARGEACHLHRSTAEALERRGLATLRVDGAFAFTYVTLTEAGRAAAEAARL